MTTKRYKSYKKRKKQKNVKSILVKLLLLVVLLSVIAYLYDRVPAWLYPVEYGAIIVEEAQANELDPLLVCALIKSESNYDADAISHVGAVGLMQLMPDTAEWIAGKCDIAYDETALSDPEYNIRLGCRYLAYLLDYWEGDIVKAIAAYNGGLTNVQNWLTDGVWDGTEADLSSIPFAETSSYTIKVLSNYENYKNLYADDIRFAY